MTKNDPLFENTFEDEQGASKSEQLIDAARRNNTDLLNDIIKSVPDPEELAHLLNNTKTPLGSHIYHEAAANGNYEVIDILLDQEGFECDPKTRIEGDTPLHSAVRYFNQLPKPLHPDAVPFAHELIFMMIESGSDPRVKNKANLTPYQLADPQNEDIRRIIQDAMDAEQMKGDFVMEDESAAGEGENSGPGSASESENET
ncbi:Ankyrin repeat-containing protein [Golovinomyces cichoracearum]|uniref:Ankyrin repeat-containing protein n=1 Tax=Golovinomyces cichoracearum TaxID=62708 RepID=A0A420IZD6_9PEZI|nr:Ankyrin repeat-containing protein [Golovinomyces cichoracearum]